LQLRRDAALAPAFRTQTLGFGKLVLAQLDWTDHVTSRLGRWELIHWRRGW
jgi:hypothetical protein